MSPLMAVCKILLNLFKHLKTFMLIPFNQHKILLAMFSLHLSGMLPLHQSAARNIQPSVCVFTGNWRHFSESPPSGAENVATVVGGKRLLAQSSRINSPEPLLSSFHLTLNKRRQSVSLLKDRILAWSPPSLEHVSLCVPFFVWVTHHFPVRALPNLWCP